MHAVRIISFNRVTIANTHLIHISWNVDTQKNGDTNCTALSTLFTPLRQLRYLLLLCRHGYKCRFVFRSVQNICFSNACIVEATKKSQNPFATSTEQIIWVKTLPPKNGKNRIWSRIYENYFPRTLTLKYSSRDIFRFRGKTKTFA